MGVIYKITNPNGRIYVGKTINLKERISCYVNGCTKQQPIIHRSIAKYGWKNHKFEILFEMEDTLLNDMEMVMIKKYNSFHGNNKMGMNLTLGGEGISGFKHRKESIEKMSINSSGKKHTEETKKKISKAGIGRVFSIETRLKNSLRQIGEKNHRYGKGIPVVLYDMQGKFIGEFINLKSAAKVIGCFRTSISAVCKGKEKSIKGFICRYKTAGYEHQLDLSNYYLRKQKLKKVS
jgi:group I intron endonuclease